MTCGRAADVPKRVHPGSKSLAQSTGLSGVAPALRSLDDRNAEYGCNRYRDGVAGESLAQAPRSTCASVWRNHGAASLPSQTHLAKERRKRHDKHRRQANKH